MLKREERVSGEVTHFHIEKTMTNHLFGHNSMTALAAAYRAATRRHG